MFVRKGYSMYEWVSSTRLPNLEVRVDSLVSNGLWTYVCSTRECDVALNLYCKWLTVMLEFLTAVLEYIDLFNLKHHICSWNASHDAILMYFNFNEYLCYDSDDKFLKITEFWWPEYFVFEFNMITRHSKIV